LALVLIGVLSILYLPIVSGPEYHHISTNPIIDMWDRWDSALFVSISLFGYGWQFGQWGRSTTSFPLYPELVGVIGKAFPEPTRISILIFGVVISNLLLLASVFVFDKLTTLDNADPGQRTFARWLLWLSPSSIFLAACIPSRFICS
jgi:hypothetical protein